MKKFMLLLIVSLLLFAVSAQVRADGVTVSLDIHRNGVSNTPTAVPIAVPTSVSPALKPVYQFTSNFGFKNTGDKVVNLQMILKVTPTGYFGNMTKEAVVHYQQDHGLTASGFVGPKTRTLLNAQLTVLATPTPVVSSTPITTVVVTSSAPTKVVTGTPTPIVVKKKSGWEGQLGLGFMPFEFSGSGVLQPGMEFPSTSTLLEFNLLAQIRCQDYALSLSIDTTGHPVGMNDYGSSYNGFTVYHPITLMVKNYQRLTDSASLVFGLGAGNVRYSGNPSQGGVKFPIGNDNSVTPVLAAGVEFGTDVRCSVLAELRMNQSPVLLPGVGPEEYDSVGDVQCSLSIPFSF